MLRFFSCAWRSSVDSGKMPDSATAQPTTIMPAPEYTTIRFWRFLARLWSAMSRPLFYRVRRTVSRRKRPARLLCSARLFRIPSLWVDGRHEGEGSAGVLRTKMAEEVAGGHLAFAPEGIVEPDAGQARRQAPEHAQHGHGSGRARAASILIESAVQSLMPGLDPPIAASAPQQFNGRPLAGISTGDEWPGSVGGIGFLFARPTAQLADLPGGHKADLLRRRVLKPELALLVASPVYFLRLGPLRRRRRGKRRPPPRVRSRFYAAPPDWFSP